VKSLGSLDLTAQTDQIISSFAGKKKTIVVGYRNGNPITGVIPDGLSLQISGLPGRTGELRIDSEISYTKVLSIDDVKTAKGTIQIPHVAEVSFRGIHLAPFGQPILMGLMGPLPESAGELRQVLLVGRFSRQK